MKIIRETTTTLIMNEDEEESLHRILWSLEHPDGLPPRRSKVLSYLRENLRNKFVPPVGERP